MKKRSQVQTSHVWWWITFLIVYISSIITRVYKINKPQHVCWDETHFGKMGSWYINRTLFFDVHPPLGKMLVALGGILGGYDGNFSFTKPGEEYGEDVPYVLMRIFGAIFASSIGPLCYCITWDLSRSFNASLLASCLVMFDTGLLTIGRFILLDPFMLFFIMFSTFCFIKFRSFADRAFSFHWWMWLSATGISLACTMSIKFVGLFVILFVGITTIGDLWRLLGNLSLPMSVVVKQFLAHVLCLILLPVMTYLVIFRIHLGLLTKSGNGDGFFSSAFQSQLEGNPLYNATMPEFVAYNSIVTLKNHRTGGNYLHSHAHLYPESFGTTQQQVTAYSHNDENNEWTFRRHNRTSDDPREPVEYVRNGDLVYLEHVATQRNLHSHREPAPLTRKHYQISCYGNDGIGDENDVFRLEILGASAGERLSTVRSLFRLIHVEVGCALHSHDKQLPIWGWEQLEVTCNPNVRHLNNLWNIEQVFDPRLENSTVEVYKLNFLQQVIEFHAVMIRGNRGLKPKEGDITSMPWQWPINYKGQPFSGPDYKIYLLGNPVIWWSSFATIIVFVIVASVHAIIQQRQSGLTMRVKDGEPLQNHWISNCWWLLMGWALHYFPFWTMGRVLYFHHYFSAFLYSVMLTAIVWDSFLTWMSHWFGKRYRWVVQHTVTAILYSIIAYSFYLFCPLSYGVDVTILDDDDDTLERIRWLDSWDF